jgi:large subunit ribosomal protein L14e
MFEAGRICVKTAGREAGKYCVIVKKMEESFVLITGPKSVTEVKRRRCNINHLEPTMEKLKISADASDSEVEKALKEIGFYGKFYAKVPEKPKAEKKEEVKVKEKPKEERKPEKKEKVKHKEKRKAKPVKKPKKSVKKEKPKKPVKKAKKKSK